MKITTIKSRADYRAAIEGKRFHFVRVDDAVWIYTPTANLGGYNLDRFGGTLTPASIRKFMDTFLSPESGGK